MKISITVILLIMPFYIGLSKTYRVGPEREYKVPSAVMTLVEKGDSVLIDKGEYSGDAGVWQPDSLYISAVNGKAHLKADGNYSQGKGIWVIKGDGVTVENIEFSGASVPDKNGAGIRHDGGSLTIRNCCFHDNENGILGGHDENSTILIEHSEFARNGSGDGYSHNLYINHVGKLIFRFNYSHHAKVGHNLKSRAHENHIMYNRIMDEETGNSSRLLDLPNGGPAYIVGNILMQGPNAENNNLIGYGLEGLSNPTDHKIYIINNTMCNKRHTGNFIDIRQETEKAYIYNNILTGTVAESDNWLKGEASAKYNMRSNDIDIFKFVDEKNYNFRLLKGSPAIDAGGEPDVADASDWLPVYEYVHPLDYDEREKHSTIDIGAYEYDTDTSLKYFGHNENLVKISPQPVVDKFTVRIDGFSHLNINIKIYNIYGEELNLPVYNSLINKELDVKIDAGSLPSGTYFIIIDNYFKLKTIKK